MIAAVRRGQNQAGRPHHLVPSVAPHSMTKVVLAATGRSSKLHAELSEEQDVNGFSTASAA